MSDFELPAKSLPAAKKGPAPGAATAEPTAPPAQEKPPSKYPQEELLAIFDHIIFSGEYQESVAVNSRLNVTFRTRTAEEINDIQMYLDSANLKLITTVDNVRSLMTLAASLVSYHTKDLSLMSKDDKMTFLKKLPSPVVGALFMALQNFDEKIQAAVTEGQENF